MELKTAVAAVIKDASGRYLIIRRGQSVPAPGYWTPLTGRVEPGESLESAVEREALEEVGLAVKAGQVLYRCPTVDGTYLIHWLEAALVDPAGAITLKDDEVAEARWLTAAEAARLEPMFPATRAFFEERART